MDRPAFSWIDPPIVTSRLDPQPDGHRHYHYVDLLRGAAAALVMVGHYLTFFPGEPSDPFVAQPPGYQWLWPLYRHGGVAVFFFWALSGFVFAIAYGRYGKGLSLRDFVVHRFARLYPLHFVTLLIVAAVQTIGLAINGAWQVMAGNDLPNFLLHLVFASNWFTRDASFNGPIWSVSIEILVYLVFLAYMKAAGLRVLPAVALFAGFVAIEVLTSNLIALCGALFFAGLLLGIAVPWIQQRLGRRSILLALAALLLAVAGLWCANRLGLAARTYLLGWSIWYGLLPALLFLFATLDHNCPPLSPRLRWIGAITYAVYLLHMPLIIAARTFAPEFSTDVTLLRQWPTFLAYVGIVVALAVLVHYRFELPAQRYFRRRLASKP